MIRIAFPEASAAPIGGYQYSTFDIIEHLVEESPRIDVYYVTHEDTPAGVEATRRRLPAKITTLGRRGFPGWRHPGWIGVYMLRAWRFLRDERIDIVQASNETLPFWLIPCLFTRTVPIWNVRAEIQPGLRSWLRQKLQTALCRRILYVSEATRKSVERNGIPKSAITALIHNFVPKRLENAPQHVHGLGPVAVGFVGRLDDPVKDARRALRIAIRVLSDAPRHVEFVFWGPASRDTRKSMDAQVPDTMKGQIRFLGIGTAEEVFRSMDVLLLTSRSEGMPRVIMEAGMHGIPAVAAAVGGVPELVRDGENGYLFDSDDQAAARLLKLVKQHRLRQQKGMNARRRFFAEFNRHSTVRHYLTFYDSCLQRGTSRGAAA